jgi:ketosteroid isomerase-like protein
MLRTALAGLLFAAAALPAMAKDDTAQSIIAMERAALDRSDKGDIKGFLEISAPDVVYQDPALSAPLEGIAALTAYYAAMPAFEPIQGVMSKAKVQILGELAVLSFHYISQRHGTVLREWNCTEVYRKSGADWRIVNTHWSLTLPPGAKLD